MVTCGKVTKFNVYSFPVVVKELASQYDLGSYVGTAVGDPTQLIRFSVAPNDFQSMLFRNGQYEFIDPVDKSQSLYSLHPKTKKQEISHLCVVLKKELLRLRICKV